jgi:uncharacterized protein (UPF0276 family)
LTGRRGPFTFLKQQELMAFTRKDLGHGIGLRPTHYSNWLAEKPRVDWVEVISENHLSRGGRPNAVLEKVRAEVPVVLHGVSLAIGSVAPLDENHLRGLRDLAQRIQPAYISDHLCWGRHGGRYVHELLPLPYNDEALQLVIERTRKVQDVLQRQILLENVSSYVAYRESTMSEWEFISRVAEGADCGILLDVNNIYVSARNHGFEPLDYLNGVPPERVGQFHLAGHTDKGRYLLDTHSTEVPDPVWALYREAVKRFGRVPALVEWDEHVPPLDQVIAQSAQARAVESEAVR